LALKFDAMNKRISLFLAFLFAAFSKGLAQAPAGDDFMRSMGKMYVVVAAILVIFLGIILFLVYLERRLTKLENQTKQND
jgi:CcmD family protein